MRRIHVLLSCFSAPVIGALLDDSLRARMYARMCQYALTASSPHIPPVYDTCISLRTGRARAWAATKEARAPALRTQLYHSTVILDANARVRERVCERHSAHIASHVPTRYAYSSYTLPYAAPQVERMDARE